MRILFLLLITIALASCTSQQESIDFQQVLEEAQARVNQGKSLSEDTLLVQALEHYQNLEPKDTTKFHQATKLTAYHYWWKGNKPQAYELLESIADTNKEVLKALMDLSSKDYDFEDCYRYLCRIMEDETEQNFENQQALATLHFYLNRPEECERLFNDITQYIRTPEDSVLYWRQTLPNQADIISDYGKQDKAIFLQEQVLNHFMGKDSTMVSSAYASLSRYYLLKGDLKEAERLIGKAKENANNIIRDGYMGSYMELLQSILNYAKEKRIYIKEWANFVNSIQENASIKQAITDAKEENNRLLTERNLKLTIEQQRTELTMLYVVSGLAIVITGLAYLIWRRKRQAEEKEEELEALRQLINESQQPNEQKDDRFFKKILLQQLGVIRMAASNPTTANQELIRRMTAIANKEVEVDALLNWKDLYQTIDYIYEDFYTQLKEKHGDLLNEKEIQLCCLLKANFSTKEISIVTQQGIRTVYQRKTMIRQKLGMEEKGDIVEWLA